MAVKISRKEVEQLKKDLRSTVRELSDVYEELSILYHLSQTLTGLSIDKICSRLLDEVKTILGVKTAAIMLFNEEKTRIYTAVSCGKWPPNRIFKKGNNIFWHVIEKKRPLAFCNIKDSPYKRSHAGLKAILACPLIGEKGAVGAIVTGEKKTGREFYSSDTKFIMAMSSQAALAIENAALCKELEAFFFGTVMAFVKAIESRSKWTSGHSERVTRYSLAIAEAMGMDKDFMDRLKICGLLHDIGKIGTPIEILDKHGVLSEKERQKVKEHPVIGCSILENLKPFNDIIDGIKHHHEKWNGKGDPKKLKGKAIPLMARIIAVADTFDAMTSDRPYRKKMGIRIATREIFDNSGKQFDPAIVKVFMKIRGKLLT